MPERDSWKFKRSSKMIIKSQQMVLEKCLSCPTTGIQKVKSTPGLTRPSARICRKNPSYLGYIIVWPQWWSFADVSQQGVDFSKKISKIEIIFWFDFHRCSHGSSKIRRHFRNKSRSILKLSKNVFYKKWSPKLT